MPCSTEETPPTGVVKFEKITTGNYSRDDDMEFHPSGGTNSSVDAEDSTVAEIRASVGTYGGFYIAKYEAGIAGNKDNSSLSIETTTDGSVKPLSQAGKGVWDNISRADCLTVSKAMIPATAGAKSTLISGECWDTTLAWITATADSSYAENSAGKGWYYDVSSSQVHTTGYYGTNTNNIFDMGGNISEWTTENCSYYDDDYGVVEQYVVVRGGNFLSVASYNPASHCSECWDFTTDIYGNGFRVVLYK